MNHWRSISKKVNLVICQVNVRRLTWNSRRELAASRPEERITYSNHLNSHYTEIIFPILMLPITIFDSTLVVCLALLVSMLINANQSVALEQWRGRSLINGYWLPVKAISVERGSSLEEIILWFPSVHCLVIALCNNDFFLLFTPLLGTLYYHSN